MLQEELFKNLDILDNWYCLGYLNIEEFLKIKSQMVDEFKRLNSKNGSEDLPF